MPTESPSQTIRISTAIQIVVCVVLFELAIVNARSTFIGTIDLVQAFNWMFDYSLGYVHRGLLGSIFQMLHGEPTLEKINAIVLEWDWWLLMVLVTLTAALTLPKIILSDTSSRTRWFLLSIAALLLTAPIWRHASLLSGYLDKWVFLVALLALYALIKNRPVLYALPACIGFLIHPQMLFYALLLLLLIVHAVYFHSAHFARWKEWLAAGLLPLALALALYFLANPVHAELIKPHYPEGFDARLAHEFLYPEQSLPPILARWKIFYGEMAGITLIFNGMPLMVALVAALGLHRCIGRYRVPPQNNFQTLVPPPARGLLAFWEKHNLFVILPLATLFATPIMIVAGDFTRFLNWSWWGLTIAFIYILHCFPPATPPAKNRKPPMLPAVSAMAFLLSYTFSGAPMIVSHGGTPGMHYCFKCVDGITLNPLGVRFSEKIFHFLVSSLSPIQVTGKDYQTINFFRMDESVILRGETLAFPADFTGEVLDFGFTILPDSELRLTVRYEADEIPPLESYILYGKHPLPLLAQDRHHAVWGALLPPQRLNPAPIYVNTRGGVAFTLLDFTIEMLPR